MPTARLVVDPAELLGSARIAADVRARLVLAGEATLSTSVRSWAVEPQLAAAAVRAVEVLAESARLACREAEWLERDLAVAAESYAQADEAWVR